MAGVKRKQPRLDNNHRDKIHHKSRCIVHRSRGEPNKAGKASHSLEPADRVSVSRRKPKSTVPFHERDHILLVGEGDFSFAKSLAQQHRLKHITATCYDTEETLHQKYPQAHSTLEQLLGRARTPEHEPAHDGKEKGLDGKPEDDDEWHGISDRSPPHGHISVHYAVNATKLATTHARLLRPHAPFTKIVFNFPHVGGLSTDVNRQVRANQELLVGYFEAAIPLLASQETPVREDGDGGNDRDEDEDDDGKDGEDQERLLGARCNTKGQILVSLFEGEPYTLWNIRDLARHCGLRVATSYRFPWEQYPGYRHARTVGEIRPKVERNGPASKMEHRKEDGRRAGGWRGEDREARCFVLEVRDEDGGQRTQVLGKSKRRKEGQGESNRDSD